MQTSGQTRVYNTPAVFQKRCTAVLHDDCDLPALP